MTSSVLPSDKNGAWQLPPGMEEQWRTLVDTFGLMDGSEDAPLGRGILKTPRSISEAQSAVLIKTLGLRLKSDPPLPYTVSHTAATLPPPSIGSFKIAVDLEEREFPDLGFTEVIRNNLDRLAGRFPEIPKPTGRSFTMTDQPKFGFRFADIAPRSIFDRRTRPIGLT